LFDEAIAALARLPERQDLLAQAIDIRFELRNALFPLGQIEQDLNHLRAVEPVARALGDRRRLAWISAYMARDFTLLGDHARALELGQRALDIATDLGEADLQVLTHAYLGSANHALGNYRLGADLLRRSVASLGADRGHRHLGLPGPASVFCRCWLVWSLAKLGEFDEGAAWGAESVRIAQAVDQPLVLTVAHYSLGFLRLHRGDLPGAVSLLEWSLGLCRTWNLTAWFPNIASSLGEAYALSGEVAGGLALLEQAIDRAASLRIVVNHAGEMAWLGETYLLAGRIDDAATTARRALELALRHQERGNEAQVLRLLGEIALHQEPRDAGAAEAHYGRALALARELEMRPLAAHCHLGLGRLYRQTRDRARADEHLARAGALFREMDMGRGLDQTSVESGRS
jgi:tetratricopeptide (TPR) repeat protein